MKGLTKKRRAFVEEYLKCWNLTEAARRVGYKHPNVMGPRLVKVSAIENLIEQRLKEKAMSADEVLARLGEIARSEHTEYLSGGGIVNLHQMIEDDKIHLVKGIKETKYGKEVLFYDGQKALVDIGRHHGLFKDKLDLSGEVKHKVEPDFSNWDESELTNFVRLLSRAVKSGKGSTGA